MPWTRLLFKNQAKVYARVDEQGKPRTQKGLVEIRYQIAGKSYQASAANLAPLPEGPEPLIADDDPRAVSGTEAGAAASAALASSVAAPAPAARRASPAKPTAAAEALPAERVEIYADGACSGNPGPAGLGVHLLFRGEIKELSEYLGQGTNNIAELMAVKRALELVPDRSLPVYIYTDSAYTIGLLTQNWKPKANQELVAELRVLCRKFPRLHFRKVAGHAGIPGNERADELARQAVSRRS